VTNDTDDTIETDDINYNGDVRVDNENINMECKHIIKHILDLLDDE